MNKNFKNKNLKAKKRIANSNKGITLIALIITIIVLLILAVVAIRAVTGDGILAHAKNARDKWGEATANEEAMLGNITNYITDQSGNNPPAGEQATPMTEATNKVLSETENKKVEDEYGNIVVVPAGFKIVVDDTTNYENSNNPNVTDGIVIEDVSAGNQGSQFVWVPVGTVYTDKNKTEDSAKTITFGRYDWSESTGTVLQSEEAGGGFNVEVPTHTGPYTFTEKLRNSESENARAKDIVGFCTSVTTNGGYYIGRYEAGDSSATQERTEGSGTSTEGKLVCKKGQYVYNWILQKDASAKCQEMYTGKPFTSDLINSYAWDTAIIFIQKCGTEENASKYASANNCNGFKKTGENQTGDKPDKYRNIYDMSGNARELTTETSASRSYTCTLRGGRYHSDSGRSDYCTNWRDWSGSDYGSGSSTFRPLLYL